MDGLLIDSERHMWTPCMQRACNNQGKYMTDEFHNSIMGLDIFKAKERLHQEFGEDFDTERFYNEVKQYNAERNETIVIPLMKGAKELLDYCKDNGIKMAIGTSTEHNAALKVLERTGILEYFDRVVGGDEVSAGKPAPDIYLKAHDAFPDIPKEETIVFEDGNVGSIAALDGGFRLVIVPDLAILSDYVLENAFAVIEDLGKMIDIIKKENERTPSI